MVAYDFAGRTALVTGGTSGIGRATAVAFAGQWFPVAVLTVGIATHLALFAYLRAVRRREAAPHTGT